MFIFYSTIEMFKESDLTNITCNLCKNPITYEYVSFQGDKCTIGKFHPSSYAVKCSRCRKGYGNWELFDVALFPGHPDPRKCPCKELCSWCGFSKKCCCNKKFDDDLYRICQTPGCEKESRICGHNGDVQTQVKPKPKTPYYGIFSNQSIMDTILKPLKDYSNEKVNIFAPTSQFEPRDTLNRKALEYPFSFINSNDIYYKPSEICTGLVDEEPIDIGDFPNNINEYYWIHEGTNDEENWHLLCKVTAADGKDAYVYYTAGCDYTGFDCQGDMKIYISRNAPALLYGLDKDVHDKLMKAKGILKRTN
jgi:hypothetical protein